MNFGEVWEQIGDSFSIQRLSRVFIGIDILCDPWKLYFDVCLAVDYRIKFVDFTTYSVIISAIEDPTPNMVENANLKKDIK